jgi:hypothetical protein
MYRKPWQLTAHTVHHGQSEPETKMLAMRVSASQSTSVNVPMRVLSKSKTPNTSCKRLAEESASIIVS